MSSYINYKCEQCSDATLENVGDTTFQQNNTLQCFKCPQCHLKYYQCKECTSMLMRKKRQITNHFNYHKRTRKEELDNNIDAFETEDAFVESNYEDICTIVDDTSDSNESSCPKKIQYTNDASTQFFNSEGNGHIGVEQLIMKSQQLCKLDNKCISREDINLHLCYSRLSYNLGPSNRQMLCQLTQSIITHVARSIHVESNSDKKKLWTEV